MVLKGGKDLKTRTEVVGTAIVVGEADEVEEVVLGVEAVDEVVVSAAGG